MSPVDKDFAKRKKERKKKKEGKKEVLSQQGTQIMAGVAERLDHSCDPAAGQRRSKIWTKNKKLGD